MRKTSRSCGKFRLFSHCFLLKANKYGENRAAYLLHLLMCSFEEKKLGGNMSDSQNKMQSIETSFIERLAQKIGVTANAKYIYGEPVERGGITVITVAKAVYGFGGGSGKNGTENGSGGGGGAVVTPVGYIEIKNGKTRFRPTRDWLNLIPLLTAAAPVILLSTWGMTNLLGLKRGRRKADR